MKSERIAIVIDALTLGGAQQVVIQLAQHWRVNRHSVLIIAIHGGSNHLISSLSDHGIEFMDVKATSVLDTRSFLFFNKILRSFEPTQIHAHLYWSQIWSSMFSLLNPGHLLKWVEHNTYRNRTKLQWLVYRLFSRRTTAVIAVSWEVKDFIKTRGGTSATKIVNPIVGNFKSLGRDLSKPIFVLAGRLVEQKNPNLAIKAFEFALNLELIPRHSTLLIIGDGPLRCPLQEEVGAMGIVENVVFLGALDRNELLDKFASCTTLISSSLIEGDPLVRLEALASGCMVVSTSTGGIFETYHGLLRSAANVHGLAKGLSESLDPKHWQESSIQSRMSIIEDRNIETIAQCYLDSFRSIDLKD